jgi:uncharacterized membrane protein
MNRWSTAEKIVFAAFLFWSAAGLIFTLGNITPATVAAWPGPGFLRSFVTLCLKTGDPLLILLAFANTHFHAAREWSPAAARRWALIVIVFAFLVETVGVHTGFPFGAYHYNGHFGPALATVPFTIPLAWHVVVTNTLFIARTRVRRGPRLLTAACTGLLSTAYDFVLEPFATRAKHYWTWQGGSVPLENYAAWFVLSTVLVAAFAPATGAARSRFDPRPAAILLVTLAIFLAGSWSAGLLSPHP